MRSADVVNAVRSILKGVLRLGTAGTPGSQNGDLWATASGWSTYIAGGVRTLLDGSMFASTAQAQAGIATGAVMNPARTAEAIAALSPQRGQSFVAQKLAAASVSNSATAVVIPGTTFSITPATAAAKIQLYLDLAWTRGTNGANGYIELARDGAVIWTLGPFSAASSGIYNVFDAPGLGAHVYNLQHKQASASTNANTCTVNELSARDIN